MGYPRAKRNIGTAPSFRIKVPIIFLRPAGKRTMAEVQQQQQKKKQQQQKKKQQQQQQQCM